MAEPPKKPKPEDIETVPDAWERFERAIDKVTQKPPGTKPPRRNSREKKTPAT